MVGRFGPGCCCDLAFCADAIFTGKPSEVLIDFDTTDFDNDVIDGSTTGWARNVSGLDTQITETFGGSDYEVLFVDSPMISLNTTANIEYLRGTGSGGGDPSGLVPSGSRPFVLGELEFTMTSELTYAWNNGFPWFATTVAGFELSFNQDQFRLNYYGGYNYVSAGHADNGRMYRLQCIVRGIGGSGTPQTAIEIRNTASVGLPAKILVDGDVCLMRVTATSATTADVELFINGVLEDSGTASGLDFANFLCYNNPVFNVGGTLRNTDEVAFTVDNLRWEIQGTP